MKKDASKTIGQKPVIEVRNVSKHFKLPHERKNSLKQHFVGLFSKKLGYEKFEALKDINFTVNEGDFFGIVGRNGSGKSTLLKIISGIYQPNSGSVKIHGTLTPFIELGIGFNPELTGRENVYLNGSILGLTKKEIDSLYSEIVEFAELERFMDQKLKNYSSGMQVRLAFSIAIRAQNNILLLDEVLAVGDANFQKKCFDYFNKLKKLKKTVLLVSHDINTIQRYCTKGIYIKDSKMVASGDIDKITTLYKEDLLYSIEEEKSSKDNEVDESNKDKMGNINQKSDDELDSSTKEPIRKSLKPVSIKNVLINGKRRGSIIDQSMEIELKITYQANKYIEDPILGVLIFHESNPFMPVFGVNTINPERITDNLKLKVKDLINFNVNFKNNFSQGSYNAKIAVADSSGAIVLDELTVDKIFISNQTKNNFSVFQSEYKISISKECDDK